MGTRTRFAGVLAGGIAAGVGVLGSVGGAQAQQATFEGIGFLLPGVQYPNSSARNVSGDGGTAVGYSLGAGGIWGVYWTKQAGLVPLEPSPTFFPDNPLDASHDGSAIAGNGWWYEFQRGFHWTAATGPVSLGVLPLPSHKQSSAPAITPDGQVVVGASYTLFQNPPGQIAFRWMQGEMAALPMPPGMDWTAARCISGDGSVIVGNTGKYGGPYAVLIWYDLEPVVVAFYPGSYGTVPKRVSDDGGIVLFGYSVNFGKIGGTLRWTPAGGYHEIEPIPGIKGSTPYAMTPDGAMIVGYMSTDDVKDGAFIWDAAHGMRSLRKLLTETYGLDLGEWRLVEAQGISDDGTVIVGRRNDMSNGVVEGFIATIPPLCRPDCDTNGILDIDDFLCFQLRFAQGHVYADYNIDGILDIDDFLAFHLAFSLGC